jgi:hypothetical protein
MQGQHGGFHKAGNLIGVRRRTGKRQFKHFAKAHAQPTVVDIPTTQYIPEFLA